MAFVALVTLLALGLYMFLAARTAKLRGKAGIKAPATTGDERFERAFRIHQNTLEQMMFFLPAMWITGYFVTWTWAGIAGLVWIAGRVLYAISYKNDPPSRGPGFLIAFAAASILWLVGLIGAISSL